MAFSSKIAVLVLRLTLGTILLAHGLLMSGVLGGGESEVAAAVAAGNLHGLGEPYRIASTVIQTLGGLMLLLGLAGRLAALAAAVLMAHRVLFASAPYFFAKDNGFEVPLALGIMALSLVFLGSGPLSVDALIAEGRRKRTEVGAGPDSPVTGGTSSSG